MTNRVDRYDAYLDCSGEVMHEKVGDGEYVKFSDYAALLAERDALLSDKEAMQSALSLEFRKIDTLEEKLMKLRAENEGALAIIASERAEVLKLRAENQRLRETLHFISDAINWELNPSNYTHDEVCALNAQWIEMGNTASAALAEQEKTDEV